jgi:predicted amidohydrolase YtcJ
MIDLKGNLLLPGMIDSHCHAVDRALSIISAYIRENVNSVDEVVAFAADAKKSGRGMQGDILIVQGVPLRFWSKNKELNERFNTGMYANQPVLLRGMDGHTAWANKALLQRAGINKQLISGLDAVGRGYYGFGPDLEPNGFLVHAGVDKADLVVPRPTEQRMLEAGRAASQHLHSLGITAWLDPMASEAILKSYRGLSDKGELKSHVGAIVFLPFSFTLSS